MWYYIYEFERSRHWMDNLGNMNPDIMNIMQKFDNNYKKDRNLKEYISTNAEKIRKD